VKLNVRDQTKFTWLASIKRLYVIENNIFMNDISD